MALDTLEKALAEVGYGRWQIPVVVITVMVHMLAPVHLIGATLLNAQPPFRCRAASQVVNFTTSTPNFVLRPENSTDLEDFYNNECRAAIYSTSSSTSSTSYSTSSSTSPTPEWRSTGLASCPEIVQDESTFSSTVSMEWQLVCERSWLRPIFQMAYSVGSMVGSTGGGHVSDRYGRKRAIQIACGINLAAVVGMLFLPWYSGVLAARVLSGCSIGCMILPVFSLALETTPSRQRTLAGMLLGTSFSAAVVLFAGVGYFVRTWRCLLLAGSVPLLVVLPLAFLVSESPRWLSQQGRGHEAAVILGHAASRNRVQLSAALTSALRDLQEESQVKEKSQRSQAADMTCGERVRAKIHQITVYLRFPALRRIIVATTGIWYLQGLLYLGIILNANNFTSNDPYIYVAMSGTMDLMAILLATPLNMRMGRRFIVGGAMLMAGVLLLVDLAVPEEFSWIRWVLVMTSLLLIAAAFQVNFMYVPELYPTVIRSRGFALASLAGSFGFLTAPFITDVLAQKTWWAVGATFGSAGILGSFLVPLLPETNNLPLPDTVEDVERRRKGIRADKKGEPSQDEQGREAEEMPALGPAEEA
ncbi:solute carrier family 22 member 20-like [Penaeus chinensis]|uniref:solute carrier family 22 member 20-like n=1 Tax=Penaeus chinensis TaxID=139456 RepID=UPI001FB68669|nr:solute carrier family 22 member 20-like [Penaeus chinensis]XP_047474171.1 solute carrier family 22 member 20-like [Penaeus chinensis]